MKKLELKLEKTDKHLNKIETELEMMLEGTEKQILETLRNKLGL